MQLLAIGLAASLVLGPAPGDEGPVAEPPAPTVEAPAPEPAPPVVHDGLGCNGNKPCRRMSVAGIVVGTLGLAAVGTGIYLLLQPVEVIPESPTFITSTHPAGLVTLTLGAGITLTAVLMEVASHRGYKQRHAARRVEPLANGLRF